MAELLRNVIASGCGIDGRLKDDHGETFLRLSRRHKLCSSDSSGINVCDCSLETSYVYTHGASLAVDGSHVAVLLTGHQAGIGQRCVLRGPSLSTYFNAQ